MPNGCFMAIVASMSRHPQTPSWHTSQAVMCQRNAAYTARARHHASLQRSTATLLAGFVFLAVAFAGHTAISVFFFRYAIYAGGGFLVGLLLCLTVWLGIRYQTRKKASHKRAAAEKNVQKIKEDVEADGEIRVDLDSLEHLASTADAGGDAGLFRPEAAGFDRMRSLCNQWPVTGRKTKFIGDFPSHCLVTLQSPSP